MCAVSLQDVRGTGRSQGASTTTVHEPEGGADVFLPGHRVGLEVASSTFPRDDRNTVTGGVIAEESLDQGVLATNRVLTGPEHPSRLVLPVIDR